MKAAVHIDIQELACFIREALLREITSLLAQKTAEPDILFTVETLAEYLNVSKQWVYERVHLKEIPYIKLGKFPRFKKSDIDRWLDTLRTPAISPLSAPLKNIRRSAEKTG